jgi:hypothetical protein
MWSNGTSEEFTLQKNAIVSENRYIHTCEGSNMDNAGYVAGIFFSKI